MGGDGFSERYAALAWYANHEFDGTGFHGHAFNGNSLITTLQSLTAEQAASTETHEGYSAWEVTLHLAYCKHFFARHLRDGCDAYAYDEGIGGFARPRSVSDGDWQALIRYLEAQHAAAMDALASITDSTSKAKIESWDMTVDQAAIWLCGHDSYHLAQIRSMGVPGLKSAKLPY